MNKFAVLGAMLALTGCASIVGEKVQPLTIKTLQGDKEVAGINCTLANDAGNWSVTSPGSVAVHKSTGDLAIDCKKDELAGNMAVVSRANGAVWGNILAGGVIGYVVDRQTGAGFDYPTNVTIMLRRIEGAPSVQGAAEVPPRAAPQAMPAAPHAAAPAVPAAAAIAAATTAAAPAAQQLVKPMAVPAPQPAAAPAKPAKPVTPVAAGNPFVEGTMAESNPALQR